MAKGKNKKSKSVVVFEEEVIKKESAEKLLHNLKIKSNSEFAKKKKQLDCTNEHKKDELGSVNSVNDEFSNEDRISKKTKNKKKNAQLDADKNIQEQQMLNNGIKEEHIETKENTVNKVKKKRQEKRKLGINEDNDHEYNSKKQNKSDEETDEVENVEDQIEANTGVNPEIKKSQSKRAMKRKKHMKLVEEKKLQSELKMQQNTLNYLSKWKYSRGDWKYEKLKQIWLQQNLYDSSKIPNEFWETTLEYFCGSKGFTRETALKEALKIIEENGAQEEKLSNSVDVNEDYQTKVQRARDIIQNLQE